MATALPRRSMYVWVWRSTNANTSFCGAGAKEGESLGFFEGGILQPTGVFHASAGTRLKKSPRPSRPAKLTYWRCRLANQAD
jgi:hypothetical protein